MLEKLEELKEAFENGDDDTVSTLIDECIALAQPQAAASSGGVGNGPPPSP
jgi:hypothetical protein